MPEPNNCTNIANTPQERQRIQAMSARQHLESFWFCAVARASIREDVALDLCFFQQQCGFDGAAATRACLQCNYFVPQGNDESLWQSHAAAPSRDWTLSSIALPDATSEPALPTPVCWMTAIHMISEWRNHRCDICAFRVSLPATPSGARAAAAVHVFVGQNNSLYSTCPLRQSTF